MKQLLTISIMLLISSGYILGLNIVENAGAEEKKRSNDGEQGVHERTGPITVDVHLKRVYLDGRTIVNVKPVTIWSMEDFRARFSDWERVDQDRNKVVFKKDINDISPLLKTSGYFGLSEDHTLKIYKGKPENKREDKRAIHTFFQIDVKELESELKHDLENGIPVKTKARYQKVIRTLKPYTMKR